VRVNSAIKVLNFSEKFCARFPFFFVRTIKLYFFKGAGGVGCVRFVVTRAFSSTSKLVRDSNLAKTGYNPPDLPQEMSGREHLNAIFPWNFRNMIPKALANTQKTLGKVLPRCREACTTHEGSIALELQRVLQMM